MKIQSNYSLANETTFCCGGKAKWFCAPQSFEEFANLLKFHKGKFFVLGGGSKTLCVDEGFDGLVISTKNLCKILRQNNVLVCDAGVRFATLQDYCIQHGLGGLEWTAGIPASVGGAVVMNAGAFSYEFSDSVLKVEVFENGQTKILEKKDIQFSYRNSSLKGKTVFRVWLELKPSLQQEVEKNFANFLATKNLHQPTCFGSAGSIFKRSADVIPAKIIDKLGLKGVKIGGAEISTHHSGFIINTGNATASDVLALIDLVQANAKKHIGVAFENEIIILR